MRDIADDITSGRVRVGERLPTEDELGERYGAGRHTIREAIRGLVDLGMVERRPRLGTRVISAEPVVDYRWLPTSGDDVVANMKATWIVRPKGESVVADEALAARVGCEVGERWFRFAGPRILRDRRNREPVCYSEQYVPDTPEARRAIASADMLTQRPARQVIEQEIRAALLDGEQAEALHAEVGAAALVVLRRHRDAGGRLVAVGVHTHPADRFSIRMDIPPSPEGSNGPEPR